MSGAFAPEPNDQAGGLMRRLLPAASPSQSSSSSPADMAGLPEQRLPSPKSNPVSPGSNPPAGSLPQPTAVARRRRQATTAACGACRRRKSKCNGERPVCSVCKDRGSECEFDTNAAETHTQALKRKFNELQSQKTTYEQIYEVLQTRPSHEVAQVLERIRGGADINSILRYVNFGDVLVQLSVIPEARYRYEFPYSSQMPSMLLRPDNPYLDSDIYEFSLRTSPDPVKPPPSPHSSEVSSPTPSLQHDPYTKPFHAAALVHPLLETVKPSTWTSVSTDDVLMRKLLHEYLLFEYDWFTFFHKDYFLQDMANGRPRFCSRLLVNAILCCGSHCYRGLQNRSEHWNPKNIGYQLLAEAKRLFEYESDLERPKGSEADPAWVQRCQLWAQRRLTTIQAALVLALIYACNGSDKVGWRYTLRAIEMAYEIRLFEYQHDMDDQSRCVWEFTAWSVFVWQGLNCWYYFRPPLRRSPPEFPLPDPFENTEWYGETWVKYPLASSRLPTYHPLLFKAKADLWAIMNDYSLYAFGRSEPHKPLPTSDVLWFYKRLLAWHDALPEQLSPRRIVFPHQIMLHMQYNHILIGILKPIRGQSWDDGLGTSGLKTPYEAYVKAVVGFETVVRLYYLRHGFDAFDSFLVNFFGHLGHMALDVIALGHSDPEHSKSTMLLAAKGLYDQSNSHYVAKVVLRLQLSLMRHDDIQLLRRIVKIEADNVVNGPLEQPVQSDWPAYGRAYDEDYQSLSGRLQALALEPDLLSAL